MEDSALDRTLIRQYGLRTPEEIGFELGIDAHEVMRRTEELLGERDYLQEEAQIKAIMAALQEVVTVGLNRIKSGEPSNRDISGIMNAITNGVNKQLSVLDRIHQRSQANLEQVHRRYAQELARIAEEAYNGFMQELVEDYPEIPIGELEARYQAKVIQVAAKHDSESN